MSRHFSESVVITLGDTRVTVTVVKLDGHAVRLGFEADQDVQIHRSEIQELVDARNERNGSR